MKIIMIKTCLVINDLGNRMITTCNRNVNVLHNIITVYAFSVHVFVYSTPL